MRDVTKLKEREKNRKIIPQGNLGFVRWAGGVIKETQPWFSNNNQRKLNPIEEYIKNVKLTHNSTPDVII